MPYDWRRDFVKKFRKEDLFLAESYLMANVIHEGKKCSFFGCGRTLSPQESLYGSRCPFHQNEERIIDLVDKVLKHK